MVAYAESVGFYLVLVVENVGTAPAFSVTVNSKGDAIPWRHKPDSGLLFEIGFLPPKVRRTRLIEFMTLGMDAAHYPPVAVESAWADRMGMRYTADSLVEVAPLIEVREKTIHDVAEALEKIAR